MTTPRHTYWHIHPRNFANECDLVRAASKEEADWLESHDYDRLTLAQVRRHISFVNAENNAWGSGRAFGPLGWDEAADVISIAEAALYA